MTTVLIVLLVVAIGAGLGYFNYLAAKKRREAFAAFAAQQGFGYAESNDPLANQWSGTPFQTGDHCRRRGPVPGTRRPRGS